MESPETSHRKRLITGILIGVILFLLTGGAYSLAILMVSILVFGCTHSPPDLVYGIVFFGFPVPLILTSILVPYLYVKRQSAIWMILTSVAGILLSCLIFLVWFLILTQYC